MKATMMVPSYWGRKKDDGWKETDSVYDHPTPLDGEDTLRRFLDSLAVLEDKDFQLVVLGIATAEDIQQEVEDRLGAIIAEAAPAVATRLFSYSHLSEVHAHLREAQLGDLVSLLQLDGYSNVRNLCTFVPHILGSETAVLIDDDEVLEDPRFMSKALAHIGTEQQGRKALAVAGYYLNPDGDFFLNREISPWMTYWNKIDSMNRAFDSIIASEPRLKETPFAFGGNLVIHRDLFMRIPFDPTIPRGEDIDFLINARMFGYIPYLDNQLSIKHLAPPKSYPLWRRTREDILRFVFEKKKLDTQKEIPGMTRVAPEDLDPYPGEFLKDDLEERIFRSNQMIAADYQAQGDTEGVAECMRNIYLAYNHLRSPEDPFQDLVELQKSWERLMSHFADESQAADVNTRINWR
jgi:hypothetical protein